MKVTLKNGYVENYAVIGDLVDGIEVANVQDMDSFKKNYSSYHMNLEKTELKTETDDLAELRIRREEECFPYINRGMLWYEKLTTVEKEELSAWYQDWLDVTESKEIPEKPGFLD